MDERFASLLEDVRALIERIGSDLPDVVAEMTARAARFGYDASGRDPLQSLAELLAVADRLGPEAWPGLAARIDAWVGLVLDPNARAHHPLIDQLESLLERIVALASETLVEGARAQSGSLDDLLMPWLEKLSAACVDAMVGRTTTPEQE